MKKALITGITGQDGSYLAELLLAKGYQVHGIIRRSSSINTHRIDHIYQESHDPTRTLHLHYGNLEDGTRLATLLAEIRPDEIYNLAAQSHVRVSFDEPVITGDVTALGSTRLLEAIVSSKTDARYYQASSSEMFGAQPAPQSESTAFYPRSPYGVAKLYSHWMTTNYREAHGIHAVSGILFNHESPRRGETFVTRKITRAAARISEGLQSELYLGNLESMRDWGYAPDYVVAMWRMLQLDEPRDIVVGTGASISIRDFLEHAFSAVGLSWQNHVRFDERFLRPTEVDHLQADNTLARNLLEWKSHVDAKSLAEIMVEHDLKTLTNRHPDSPQGKLWETETA